MSVSDQLTCIYVNERGSSSREACYAVNVNEKSRSVSVWQMLLRSDPCNLIKAMNGFTLL